MIVPGINVITGVAAAPPPAGFAFGWNFRATEGAHNDGDVDVWGHVRTTHPFPTSFSNAAETVEAGWCFVTNPVQGDGDTAEVDPRLGGDVWFGLSASGSQWWGVRLTAGVRYRFRFGAMTHTGNPVVQDISIYDDAVDAVSGNIIYTSPQGTANPNQVMNVLGTIKTVADWIADYDTDVWDMPDPLPDNGTDSGVKMRIGRPGGNYGAISHLRIEEL